MMDVDLVCTWREAAHVDLTGRVAVVIDVLRASSTIVAALSAGAERVVTVATVDEAAKIADELGRDNVVLGGERGSVKLPGFDLGNSPREYTPEAVGGRTVVLTTTNGTQAVRVSRVADSIIVAGVVNAEAVAQWLLNHGKDVTVVCSGTEGRLSLDDLHCGGLLLSRLLEPGFIPQLSDGVRIAVQWFASNAGNALPVLQACRHGRRLVEKGFGADVEWCAAVDSSTIVPLWDGDGFVAA